MKNFFCYIGALVSVIIIASVFLLCYKESDTAAEFLKSYGWETDRKPVECVEIKIPEEFDDVYLNYNELQKAAGLDLEMYKNKKGVRYTFVISNYPSKVDAEVRANVIMIDGKPVGGDISTVSIDGFMYPLNGNNTVCFNGNVGIN